MAQRRPGSPYNDEYYRRERRSMEGNERPIRRNAPPPASRERRSTASYEAGNSSGRRPAQYSSQNRRPSGNYNRRPSAKRRRRKSNTGKVLAVLFIIVLLAAGAFAVWKTGILNPVEEVVEDIRPVPDLPKVISTATIGATGDILLHTPVLNAHQTWDGYDFTYTFSNVSPIYKQADLMFANFEITLGGPDYGDYTGYPVFNSPDEIATALKNAGVDICLTANNHTNDTGYYGMMRTLEVLDSNGLEHLGTRKTTDEHYLMVKNVNGIRLGMICYTYDTREYTDGVKSLNGGILSDEAEQKVNTFSYEYLDEFYADIQHQLDNMDMLNCDAKVVFLHWGTEYQDYPNADQNGIAQKLCEMGVDVIIGGHPHVIQQFETLTSSTGHETICLYSMGNELSNQRVDLMEAEDGGRGYTEDGLVIQVTFNKFNNGKVKIGAVNIVPTWVQLDGLGYQIIGMPGSDPWSWGSNDTYSAIASYNRTIGRVGADYINYREQKHQDAIVEHIE